MTEATAPRVPDAPPGGRGSGLRALLAPPRVVGVDVARGLAVLGMMGAHVGVTAELQWASPSTWSGVVDGRPSLLFALLAGVSVALVTSGYAAYDADRLRVVRLRLLGRGAVVFAIGIALESLGTGIAVILTLYGVLFVAVIPFLGWRRRHLLLLATASALLGPALTVVLGVVSNGAYAPGANLLFFNIYPVTLWLAILLVGLAIGRTGLTEVATAVTLLVGGAGLALAGYAAGSIAGSELTGPVLERTTVDPSQYAGFGDYLRSQDLGQRVVDATLAVAPHTGGALEAVGSGGFVVAVLGLCLLVGQLLAPTVRWVLAPLAAVGSMPLTVYTVHVVAFFVLVTWSPPPGDNTLWWQMNLVALAGATVWVLVLGRGPLERLTARVADATAALPPPSRGRPAPTDVRRSHAPSPTREES